MTIIQPEKLLSFYGREQVTETRHINIYHMDIVFLYFNINKTAETSRVSYCLLIVNTKTPTFITCIIISIPTNSIIIDTNILLS